MGDKPETLLVRQLRGEQAKHTIHQLKSKTGDNVTNPEEMNETFRLFYSDLYSAKCNANQDDYDSFFDSLNFPQLDEIAKEDLDGSFSEADISDAIKSFPSDKAPGPDGFGCEFYKTFSLKLAPYLLRMVNDSYKNGKLPNSLYEANICVLLKRGKDDTDPANYRPISLVNFDQKVITKILANKLGKHISTIVHPDQTGFIPGHFSFGNVRLLLNILYKDLNKEPPGAIISLDAQKAFDQIKWPYILKTLEYFGFGSHFIKWIKILYLCPHASILTNSNKSNAFKLGRGVRQGDPLSPLLFDIALEPLAMGIRSHPHIHGIKIGDKEALVSLYADDLLLYLSDPAESVSYLLEYIKDFGKISGYTINWSKSEFMLLARHTNRNQIDPLPFKIVEDCITYLGIKIPKDPKQIF